MENQTYTYILSDTQGGIKGQGGWKGSTCTSPDTPGGWKGGRGVGEVKHTATRRLWQPTNTYNSEIWDFLCSKQKKKKKKAVYKSHIIYKLNGNQMFRKSKAFSGS